MAKSTDQPAAVTRYSPWLIGWFHWYLRRYVPKHFHSVALSHDPRPVVKPGEPLIVYLNHASWWDPLTSLVVARHCFADRRVYAPFDAQALERYPMFERLGFFGVEQHSRNGAAEFLRTASSVLASPAASLWITPEGRFCDPRDQTNEFEPGLAHVVSRTHAGVALPLAIEYSYWEERLPEVLIRFGEPVHIADFPNYAKEDWQAMLQNRLRDAQQQLAELSLARQADAFELILGGKRGVGGMYDGVRRTLAAITGRRYQPGHGDKLQT